MMFNLFMDFMTWMVGNLTGMVPGPPAWAWDGFFAMATAWNSIHGFDTWVPVTLTFAAAGAVVATWLLTMIIGAVRVVVSYLTFGGGAT